MGPCTLALCDDDDDEPVGWLVAYTVTDPDARAAAAVCRKFSGEDQRQRSFVRVHLTRAAVEGDDWLAEVLASSPCGFAVQEARVPDTPLAVRRLARH